MVCFDGIQNTLDDFRFCGYVNCIGKNFPNCKVKNGDWFVLFDVRSTAIVSHGHILAPLNFKAGSSLNFFEFEFKGQVSRKKNKPICLKNECLSFLSNPQSKRLLFWKDRAITKISKNEFDLIFFCWWGVEKFSVCLPKI